MDHANLAGGHSTPVLTTHSVLSIIYPIFAVTVIGLILAGMHERALGSAWIGWLGIIGAAAHGAAAPIVAGLGILEAGMLFLIFMLSGERTLCWQPRYCFPIVLARNLQAPDYPRVGRVSG